MNITRAPSVRAAAYRALPVRTRRGALARMVRQQSARCRRGGSNFYADLLVRVADDVERGGLCWRTMSDAGFAVALPLRFMAGVHHLALSGDAPELARHYPSVGGDGDAGAAWGPLCAAVVGHSQLLRDYLRSPVQTNEVARCRALLGGFLLVASEMRRPMRLLEIGASAGLNLRWDRYAYEAGGRSWGDPLSPVRLVGGFATAPPYANVPVEVVDRRGCDLTPVDPVSEAGRLRLLAYTWGDQPERIRTLEGALALAAAVPAAVEAADALDWLPAQLAQMQKGVATVVYHSYVLQLLSPRARSRVTDIVREAGTRATPDSPLAWLQYEFVGGRGTVRLTCWPSGSDRVLAVASAHGNNIEWGQVSPVAG